MTAIANTASMGLQPCAQQGVAAPAVSRHLHNRDSNPLYRHDSYFYYFTGFNEPQVLLVPHANSAQDTPPVSFLFCCLKHEERARWDGFRFDSEAAHETFGLDMPQPLRD